jgi:hypothetical protein
LISVQTVEIFFCKKISNPLVYFLLPLKNKPSPYLHSQTRGCSDSPIAFRNRGELRKKFQVVKYEKLKYNTKNFAYEKIMIDTSFPLSLPIFENTPLSEVLEKIQKCPKNIRVILHLQEKWQYAHSLTGIKQLKDSIGDKNIAFVTEDMIAKKLIESFGIEVFTTMPQEAKDYKEELSPQNMFHIWKTGTAFENEQSEIIKIIHKATEDPFIKTREKLQEMTLKNKIFLSIGSVFGVVLLFFLFSLLLPKATIKITPETKGIEVVVNSNFIKTDTPLEEQKRSHGNNFYLSPFSFEYEDSVSYPVISKVFEGQNAKGIVTLYNNFTESITLKKGTRLTTKENLVFFTSHYVRIPARYLKTEEDGSSALVPGSAKVEVIANEFDLLQEVIGARGNISPTLFSIPGLTSYMQKFIWGENENAFTGGTTRFRTEVQEIDIVSAKNHLTLLLENEVQEKLKKMVAEKSTELQTPIEFLPLKDGIFTEILSLETDDVLGQNINEFFVRGKMRVSAYVFLKEDFSHFMEEHLLKRKDPDMKINTINWSGITYRKFEETPAEIRIAVSLQGRQSFQILGTELEKTLKNTLRGMDSKKAVKLLHNHEQISKASISLFPPVKKKLPLLVKRIVFEEE